MKSKQILGDSTGAMLYACVGMPNVSTQETRSMWMKTGDGKGGCFPIQPYAVFSVNAHAKKTVLVFLVLSPQGAVFRAIASATLMPSTAAERMPPA